MNPVNKEKIFEELRNYHVQQFPDKFKNPIVSDLRVEFGDLEDKIVGMILSLVNGKAEFLDSTADLNSFQDKLTRTLPEDGANDANRNLFTSKISLLTDLMVWQKNRILNSKP